MERKIHVFALSTCSSCKAVLKLLDQHGISYTATQVDQLEKPEKEAVVEEVRRINPRLSFPTLVIGDQIIVGNQPDAILAALDLKQSRKGFIRSFIDRLFN